MSNDEIMKHNALLTTAISEVNLIKANRIEQEQQKVETQSLEKTSSYSILSSLSSVRKMKSWKLTTPAGD